MPWFRVDDTFCVHPKAVAAGNAALGLWVRAGSWCAQQLTDGFLPRHMLSALGGRTRDAQALVDAGLWFDEPGGWQFHDWTTYQPTKADVEALRAKRSEAGRVGGRRSSARRSTLKAVPDE